MRSETHKADLRKQKLNLSHPPQSDKNIMKSQRKMTGRAGNYKAVSRSTVSEIVYKDTNLTPKQLNSLKLNTQSYLRIQWWSSILQGVKLPRMCTKYCAHYLIHKFTHIISFTSLHTPFFSFTSLHTLSHSQVSLELYTTCIYIIILHRVCMSVCLLFCSPVCVQVNCFLNVVGYMSQSLCHLA